jgi:hypothetical protein
MTDNQFKAILALLMCSDPWPIEGANQAIVEAWANEEAVRRGYLSWFDAYMAS